MLKPHYATIAVLLAILLLPLGARAQSAEEDAVRAAAEWLTLVDGGEYAQSWDAASGYFRGAVTKEGWVAALQGVRGPLGDRISREVRSSEYRTELPGAPDGEYVVIEFSTAFAGKANAVETVTSKKDGDGIWRVAGYFVR